MISDRSLEEARDAGARTLVACLWASTVALVLVGLALGAPDLALAVTLSALLNAVPTWAYYKHKIDGSARIAFGIAAAVHPALYVYVFRGNPWQMDVHMYFFAALAALTILYDRRPIIVAAFIIISHHLLLEVVATSWAFYGPTDFGRVLLHAAIVLLQTTALATLTSRMAKLIRAHEGARRRSDELAVVAAASEERTRCALVELNTDYRLLAENSNDMIVRMNLQGIRLYVSPASLTLLGYRPEEMLGEAAAGEIHPDDRSAVIATCQTLLEGAEHPICTYRQRHKLGHYVWLEASYRLIRKDRDSEPFEFIATVRDVGQREKAELERATVTARLQEAHRLLVMAEDMARVGHWRLDLASSDVFWSDVVADIHGQPAGYSPDFSSAIQVYHPEDRARVQAIVDRAIRTGEPYEFSARLVRPDGSVRHVVARARAETTPDGSVTGLFGVFQDTTEAHEAAVAVQLASQRVSDSNRMLTMAEAVAHLGHWRIDLSTNSLLWSDEVYAIYGVPRNTVPTIDDTLALYHPDDLAAARKTVERAMSDGVGYSSRARIIRADGTLVHILTRCEVNRDPNGTILGFFGIVQDVTEQALAEALLSEREARFRLITEQASDMISLHDIDGRCRFMSPAARTVLGYDPDEMLGTTAYDYAPQEDHPALDRHREELASSTPGTVSTLRFRMRRRDEALIWVEVTARLAQDNGIVRSVAVCRDVSAQVASEEALSVARQDAEAAARAKSSFLANMSHEIRTPMNGVIGFTELLLSSDLTTKQRRQAELISDSGRAMMRLLNDILDLSKVEAGQMRIAEEEIDLRHALKSCLKLIAPAAEQKGLVVHSRLSDDLPKTITSDGLRLRQIILNLLGNAVKFTETGSVSLNVSLAEGEDCRLRIEVVDTGIGIAADRQAAIFEQFVQADVSTAARFGGTGLGLAISAQLAGLMGGQLTLTSFVGQGTSFVFTLPCSPGDAHVIGDSASEPAAPAPARLSPGLRVLVAEDHDVNQLLMTSMLEQLGCTPDIAPDGAVAIEMIAKAAAAGRPYSVVLMDMQMPVMDGLEATRRIRAAGVDAVALPILALTANAYSDDIEACLAAGMQAHLSKPVQLSNLERALARCAAPAVATAAKVTLNPKLVARYRERRAETFDRLNEMVTQQSYTDEDIDRVADLLHKLSGTAAMFGEAELGERARTLESELRRWETFERSSKIPNAVNHLQLVA